MKPKRIILVRHGESVGNVDMTVYSKIPDYALDLTDLGHKQARDAGRDILGIIGTAKVHAYVSPWKRARLTYTHICETLQDQVLKMVEDPLIREQDWGNFASVELLLQINRERSTYGQFHYRVPNGESGADVYNRISHFIDNMYRDFERPEFPDNALIVSHGMALRIFLCRFFRYSVEYFETIENLYNAEILVIERDAYGCYQLKTPLRLQSSGRNYDLAI